MGRVIIFILVTLLFPLPCEIIAADSSKASSVLNIKVRAGRLSLEAREVRLSEVLLSLAREAGFKHVFHGKLESVIGITFHDVPLVEGIRRLVGGNFVILIQEIHDGNDAVVKVLEVWDPVRDSGTFISADNSAVQGETLKNLQSANSDIRMNAIDMAGQFEKGTAIDILHTVVTTDEDPRVRQYAVSALSRIEGEESVMAMAAALGDEEVTVRRQVVSVLGTEGSERAIQILGQVLFGDPDPEMRLSAVSIFANLNSEAARAFLKAAAEDDDERIRGFAVNALSLRK